VFDLYGKGRSIHARNMLADNLSRGLQLSKDIPQTKSGALHK
jgi:hypothetical protein